MSPYVQGLSYESPGFTPERIGNVTLLNSFDDKAVLCVEDRCGDAKWTMVYDEGFAVKGGGMAFFVEFVYVPVEAGVPSPQNNQLWKSKCDRTFPGWYFEGDKKGCVVGKNLKERVPHSSSQAFTNRAGGRSLMEVLAGIRASIKSKLVVAMKDTTSRKAFAFDEDSLGERAKKINERQNLWTADSAAAGFARSYTVEDIVRSVGGDRSKVQKQTSFSLDDIDDPQEKEKEAFRRQCIRQVLPDKVDWSANELTRTPVINQGSCGSCYAVSSADALTSRLRLKELDKTIPALSASQVLRCSALNQGCDGGYPWLVAHHARYFGMTSEDCAGPYTTSYRPVAGALPLTCDANTSACTTERVFAKDFGYVGGYYGGGNAEDMMWSMVRDGPVVVAINAVRDLFVYRQGLFTPVGELHDDDDFVKGKTWYWEATTHAVVNVGYERLKLADGTLVDAWKLKNSWGSDWGSNGYFYIQRGSDALAVESMPVHAIFGDGKPGNPEFERVVRENLKNKADPGCVSVIEEMLQKELV